MNNSESAKKGFRTFILTLAVSLMVFSAVYYVLTTYTQNNEPLNTIVAVEEKVEESAGEKALANDLSAEVQGAKDEKTVFGEIADKKPQVMTQAVLAGATSAPQTPETTSSVPVTGFSEMTVGLILSLALFVGAMIYTVKNPRKLALAKFEKGALIKSERQK